MSNTGIVVFSGGSAANNLVDVFSDVAASKKCTLSYIIPISDNGGSSSELIRVFGGPGIGDIRSRLVRLIPTTSSLSSAAIKTLFNHRLSPHSSQLAKAEWTTIIEGHSSLWQNIPSAKRELIRSFLTTLHLEILKRARPSSTFDFKSASVGNLFLTGARLFTGSFEAAIYLLGQVCGVPEEIRVLPVVNSAFSHHICAVLEGGQRIVGQNSISHPCEDEVLNIPQATNRSIQHSIDGLDNNNDNDEINNQNLPSQFNYTQITSSPSSSTFRIPAPDPDSIEDANLPCSLPTLRLPSLQISKANTTDLPSRIARIHYISNYGQEIRPAPNPEVLKALAKAETVIYSIGSLWTSIVPCLILRDIGATIAGNGKGGEEGGGDGSDGGVRKGDTTMRDVGIRYKILILNGSLDRETGPNTAGREFDACDFVRCIVEACISSTSPSPPSDTSSSSQPQIPTIPETSWHNYITHIIHLCGENVPKVDRARLKRAGIECVRLYGRRSESGEGGGMIYDGKALEQALSAIVGKGREGGGIGGRRNTLIH